MVGCSTSRASFATTGIGVSSVSRSATRLRAPGYECGVTDKDAEFGRRERAAAFHEVAKVSGYASMRPRIASGRTPSNFIASAAASVCRAASQAATSGTSTISATRFEPLQAGRPVRHDRQHVRLAQLGQGSGDVGEHLVPRAALRPEPLAQLLASATSLTSCSANASLHVSRRYVGDHARSHLAFVSSPSKRHHKPSHELMPTRRQYA
jgi:hypothetical protein